MTDEAPKWPSEQRKMPDFLIPEAAANPNGYVAEIDGAQISDPNGPVPGEAIIGVYCVGPAGQATGEYLRNPGHGPVQDDFTKLDSFTKLDNPDHWLGWLPHESDQAVRSALESTLNAQVPGSVVEWVKIVEDPVFLTGGVRNPSDPDKIIVQRAALAVVFWLGVRPPQERIEVLTGAFSWVAAGLDQPGGRFDRTWLDLGMSRDQAEELLTSRIYEIDGMK